jgi:hypothetical protein
MIDGTAVVNGFAYIGIPRMDFKAATDELCEGITHEALARALGVSVATIRQARLRAQAKAHRSPPENWEDAVIKLAGSQIRRYRNLISELHTARQQVLLAVSKPRKRA